MSPEVKTPRRRALSTAFRVYFILCNALVLFLVLEIGSRAVLSVRRWWKGGTTAARGNFGEEYHVWLQNVISPGPGVDPGPDFAGFAIDPPLAAGGGGRCRVLFLGGSTLAFDVGRLTREALEREGVETRAFNFAVPWHCSLHSLFEFWTYVDAVRPHLVVVLHNVNDFYRGFTPPGFALPEYRPDYSHHAGGLHPYLRARRSAYDGRPVFAALPHWWDDTSLGGALRQLARDSTLVVKTGEAIRRIPRPRPQAAPMEPAMYLRALPAFRRNLENLRLSCAVKDVPVVFLTMPFTTASSRFLLEPGRFFSNDGVHTLRGEDFAQGMREFNQAVLALAAPGSLVLDLAAELTDPALFQDEVHLTPAGKQGEADRIARYVIVRELLARCREHE